VESPRKRETMEGGDDENAVQRTCVFSGNLAAAKPSVSAAAASFCSSDFSLRFSTCSRLISLQTTTRAKIQYIRAARAVLHLCRGDREKTKLNSERTPSPVRSVCQTSSACRSRRDVRPPCTGNCVPTEHPAPSIRRPSAALGEFTRKKLHRLHAAGRTGTTVHGASNATSRCGRKGDR
jgi:hypothetical protein